MTRIVAALIAAVVTAPACLAAQPEYPEVDALRTWVDAVTTHVPGRVDPAVAAIAPLTYAQRGQLNAAIDLFLAILAPRPKQGPVATRGEARRQIAAIARATRESPGAERFLERAAILHMDAAIAESRFPPPVDDVPRSSSSAPGSVRRPDSPPPLLNHDVVTLDKDGEVIGETLANWNWPFARFLLDKLLTLDGPDFVRQWYQAATAYLFSDGLYAEALPHLNRAAELFPEDPDVLFDRGCYAEIMGLPIHQVLTGEKNVTLPSASKANEEAEKLFSRAVEVNPAHGEARVRLARLLGIRGRHDAALAQLTEALALEPDGDVAFYAHLFAGRETAALGQLDEAAGHYAEASRLFPDAQSALLGASEVALLQGEMAGVRAPLQRLGSRSASGPDPWWDYQLASGRGVKDVLTALWSRLAK